jgi:hypothetical protein
MKNWKIETLRMFLQSTYLSKKCNMCPVFSPCIHDELERWVFFIEKYLHIHVGQSFNNLIIRKKKIQTCSFYVCSLTYSKRFIWLSKLLSCSESYSESPSNSLYGEIKAGVPRSPKYWGGVKNFENFLKNFEYLIRTVHYSLAFEKKS